jgi:hypothetical protein
MMVAPRFDRHKVSQPRLVEYLADAGELTGHHPPTLFHCQQLEAQFWLTAFWGRRPQIIGPGFAW